MRKESILTIRDVNSRGQGVAVSDSGKIVFVDGALPEEKVLAVIRQEKKNYSRGDVVDIEKASPDRARPECPWFGRCGGCQLQHANYDLQIKIKKNLVRESMKRIGNVSGIDEIECVASPEIWGYRNKASFPLRAEGHGKMGFFKQNTHAVVPIDRCPVLMPHIESFYISLREKFLPRLGGIPGAIYDETTGKGVFRHIVIRGNLNKEILLLAVLTSLKNKKILSEMNSILEEMKIENNLFVSSGWNLNDSKGNRIIGEKYMPLWGSGFLSESIDKMSFLYSGTAFFQVNSLQAERLFLYASELAECPEGRLVELYSGVGALTAFLAKKSRSVLAVEEWKPSVDMLNKNMELNCIDNVRGLCGRAEDLLKALVDEKPDVVVVDPPRTGCASEVLNALTCSSAKKIVYVSCNPSTLARDSAYLLNNGWKIHSIKSFDLFPQTCHVETVALLQR